MKRETALDILNRDIFLLEEKQSQQLKDLKNQMGNAYESLKPINFLKSTIMDVTHSPDIKEGVGKASIGLVSGYLLKKLFFGPSINPIKNLASIAFQALVTNVATNNSDKIKETGVDIFQIAKAFFKPKKKEFSQYDI